MLRTSMLMTSVVALGLAVSIEASAQVYGSDGRHQGTAAQQNKSTGNNCNCNAYPLPPGTRTGTPRLMQGTGGDTSPTGSYNRDACCT